MTTIDKAAKLLDIFTNVPFANRNLVVDGNKEVWNGTTGALSTTGGYTANVLQGASCGAGGAGTYAQSTFALNAATLYGLARPAKFYGTLAQTTGSTGTLAALTGPSLYRNLEGVSSFEGAPVTLSVWLWVASGTLNVTQAYVIQYFGAGGSPSANVNTLVPVNWTLTTTPQRFSILLNVPTIAGKTLGTAGDLTQVGLSLPVGATYTVNDAQWQLEYCSPQASASITGNGGAPTAFEYRGQQVELARVTRYWEQLLGAAFYAPAQVLSSTTAYLMTKVAQKRIPNATVTASAGSTFTLSTASGNFTPSALTPSMASTTTLQTSITISGATGGQAGLLQDQGAGNSFFNIDARL